VLPIGESSIPILGDKLELSPHSGTSPKKDALKEGRGFFYLIGENNWQNT
jgi:hypothetical protein